MTGSLAYRKNEDSILAGEVPEKYTRLLPHIPRGRILEIGSAEGVLALLMARRGDAVTAVEANSERHASAHRLACAWGDLFSFEGSAKFINGRIGEHLDFLCGIDTLVAVRVIYYLRGDLDTVFAATGARNVVLCGNRNRASWWQQGIPDKPGGPQNYYASAMGMEDLLARHGFEIVNVVTDGDPIVVGRR